MEQQSNHTIGATLKNRRLFLGLTKKEMAKNIMSANNYARIEDDKQTITVDKLIELLSYHNINVEEFISEIEGSYRTSISKSILTQNELYKNYISAFYNNDIHTANKIKLQLSKLDIPEWMQLNLIIATAFMDNKLEELGPGIRRRVNHELMKNIDIEWTENFSSLSLFGNSMIIFSPEIVDARIIKIIKTYPKLNEFSVSLQEKIAGIYLNYCEFCYHNKHYLYIKLINDQISNMLNIPELFIYRYLFQYYINIFSKNYKKAKALKEILIKCGYKKYTKKLPKIPNM